MDSGSRLRVVASSDRGWEAILTMKSATSAGVAAIGFVPASSQ